MRISAQAIQERETFLKDLFKTQPELSVEKANEALKGKFGSKMRPMRVYEIRGGKPASNGNGQKRGPGRPKGSTNKKSTQTRARVQKSGGGLTDLVIHCSPEASKALEQSVAALKQLGAQVEIDKAASNALSTLRGSAQAA